MIVFLYTLRQTALRNLLVRPRRPKPVSIKMKAGGAGTGEGLTTMLSIRNSGPTVAALGLEKGAPSAVNTTEVRLANSTERVKVSNESPLKENC